MSGSLEPPSPAETAADFCATLLDEWVGLGLRHAVICPGSRSTPMAVALLRSSEITCHVVHDERSGAFLALGIGAESGVPALTLSTSGTAAVHFHAAVVESDLAAVPLLVATADRPPRLQGVYAPQTINQHMLYGDAVRSYLDPGVPERGGEQRWRALAVEAMASATGQVPGPVHLNLPFDEPLLSDTASVDDAASSDTASSDTASSDTASSERSSSSAEDSASEDLEELAEQLSGRRGVIVAGVRSCADDEETEAVLRLAEALGWPVVADGASRLRIPHPNVISTFDLLLGQKDFSETMVPEVALRVGGLLTSKRLYAWLGSAEADQIGIDRLGRFPDPDGVLQRRLGISLAAASGGLVPSGTVPSVASAPADWLDRWKDAEVSARAALDHALLGHWEVSEPAVAMDAMRLVPDGGLLIASSSMPVRDLEWFSAPRAGVRVFSNRGANGIDGVTSTALGLALSSQRPTVLLTGDIAFLHDSSALTALRDRAADLVIVVIDNDGGGIFSFLPQAEILSTPEFEALFGTPHGTDLAALCAAHRLPVEHVRTRAGATAALTSALHLGGPRVVVVGSDRETNRAVHERLRGAVGRALARHRRWD